MFFFNDFLKDNTLYIALAIFVVIVAIVILFLLVPARKGKKIDVVEDVVVLDDFYAALGGESNIESKTLNGSRLTVVLKDQSLYNNEELKKHGVSRVIVMQTKLVLLVSDELKRELNKLL